MAKLDRCPRHLANENGEERYTTTKDIDIYSRIPTPQLANPSVARTILLPGLFLTMPRATMKAGPKAVAPVSSIEYNFLNIREKKDKGIAKRHT
jgi:hypothetical protein